MLKPTTSRQSKMELVYIENLKTDKYIDFSFINEICKPYYCADNGRPAIEPEIMFKMLFIGYLYGIRSETRLVEEVKVNLAYRWFLGYGIEDKIPDASVIRQNRIRRFNGTDIPRIIFNEILRQAIENRLVDGKILYSDSTHLKANTNKNKYEEEIVEKESRAYIKELNNSIVDFSPKWMFMPPSFLYGFLLFLKERNLELPESIILVELTGEYCSAKLFEWFETMYSNLTWKLMYGMQEFNGIAYGSPNGMKILDKNVYVEILDEYGTTLKPYEEGNIVISG